MENIDKNINLKIYVLLGGVFIAIAVMIFVEINSKNEALNDLKDKTQKISK